LNKEEMDVMENSKDNSINNKKNRSRRNEGSFC
jgi:hypothetical protein